MNKLLAVLMIAVLAGGCLTAADPEVYRWPVDFKADVQSVEKPDKPTYGVVRLMHIGVRSPFDSVGLAVLRADGTLAFDPVNEFAAAPELLLRGTVFDAMAASGRFSEVVPPSSVAKSTYTAEITFSRLCLDCREPDSRRACCEVRLRLLKDRDVIKLVSAAGEADAADGDYGKAFSKAISLSMGRILEGLD